MSFFDTVDWMHMDKLGRFSMHKLPYSLINSEDEFRKYQAVENVKWTAEHMCSHYSVAAFIEKLSGKEFQQAERVSRALAESQKLLPAYMEKLNNKVLPSLEESHALKTALCGPHSLVHNWCIDAV